MSNSKKLVVSLSVNSNEYVSNVAFRIIEQKPQTKVQDINKILYDLTLYENNTYLIKKEAQTEK